ncbi:MAG: toll/interleukin-1 receptor domain-containing protein [Planctomycetaceae bacterium]
MSKTPRAPSIQPRPRAKRSVKLFISYSHQNKVWMERLTPLLDGFQYDDRLRNRPLEYLHAWHDKELTAANQWDGVIQQELEEMDVFVPLVSAHFFASWYIQNVELVRAKERHAAGEILVVPILLYDTNLQQKCPFLHSFNSHPTSDRWWSSYSDPNDAHRLIDDGLWAAIDLALKRKATKKP